jgi:hypothetical protein
VLDGNVVGGAVVVELDDLAEEVVVVALRAGAEHAVAPSMATAAAASTPQVALIRWFRSP